MKSLEENKDWKWLILICRSRAAANCSSVNFSINSLLFVNVMMMIIIWHMKSITNCTCYFLVATRCLPSYQTGLWDWHVWDTETSFIPSNLSNAHEKKQTIKRRMVQPAQSLHTSTEHVMAKRNICSSQNDVTTDCFLKSGAPRGTDRAAFPPRLWNWRADKPFRSASWGTHAAIRQNNKRGIAAAAYFLWHLPVVLRYAGRNANHIFLPSTPRVLPPSYRSIFCLSKEKWTRRTSPHEDLS